MNKNSLKVCEKDAVQIALYVVFGVLTTAVNTAVFFVLRKLSVSLELSVCVAWFFSVIFAFFTNRKYVFCANGSIWHEFVLFFASRIFSGVLDFCLMKMLSSFFSNKETLLKLAVNVVVIVVNYVLGKKIVFKGKSNV